MNTIGLAMIVKDESGNILRALDSVIGLCSQLVIVDTGSTDDTPSICARNGAEVYYSAWRDDFSHSRNYALNFIRTDWILILDADEELDSSNIDNIRYHLENEKIGGITLRIINILEGDKKGIANEHRYTRLFRNKPGIRFHGSIHEQIRESIESNGYDIIDSDVIIRHYGYSEINPEKGRRNISLLEKEIEKNPGDDWLKYHKANTEFALRNLQSAKVLFEQVINSTQLSTGQNEITKIRLAQIALSEDNLDIIAPLLDFRSINPDNEGLRMFILGTMLLTRGDYKQALSVFSSASIAESRLVDQDIAAKALNLLKTADK